MQVLSTPRTRRRSKLDLRFIHTHKSGVHVGKLFVKVPNGRSETGAQLYKRYGPFTEAERAVEARDAHLARQKTDRVQALPLGRQAKPMTLSEWAREYWLKAIVSNDNSASTLDKYSAAFERHVLPHLGAVALVDLTRARILRWREDLKESTGAPMINYCLKRLKTCLAQATLDEQTTGLKANPATGVSLVKLDRSVDYQGSPSDLPLLLAAAGPSYLAAVIQVATDSGLRISEIVGLHWRDIDWERQQVVLRWHFVSSGSSKLGTSIAALRPGTKTSNGEYHAVQLSARSIEALRTSRERLLEHKLAQGKAWKTGRADRVFYATNAAARAGQAYVVPSNPVADEALVFPSDDGTPRSIDSLGNWFERVAATAGVTKTFHGLRHDCGSFLLAAGVPLTVVSKHLRHANPSITAEIYSHQIRDDARSAADAFDSLWERVDTQARAG